MVTVIVVLFGDASSAETALHLKHVHHSLVCMLKVANKHSCFLISYLQAFRPRIVMTHDVNS